MRGRADVEDALRVEFFEILVRVIDTGGGFPLDFSRRNRRDVIEGRFWIRPSRQQNLPKVLEPCRGLYLPGVAHFFTRADLRQRDARNVDESSVENSSSFSPTILANFFRHFHVSFEQRTPRRCYFVSIENSTRYRSIKCSNVSPRTRRILEPIYGLSIVPSVFLPTNLVNSPSVGAMFMRKTNPCASINGPRGFLLCPIGFNKIPEFPTTAHPQ